MYEQLEDYLSKIEKQLAALPVQEREAELREIRSHLEMMIEDNVARGCDVDEAVARALEQFGAANKIGCELMQTKPVSWLQRLRPVVAFFAALFLMVGLNFLFSKFVIAFSYSFTFRWQDQVIWIVFSAAIAGWVAEVIAPQKAILPIALLFYGILGLLIFRSGSVTIFAYTLFALTGTSSFVGAWLRRWQVEQRTNQIMTPAE